jgi:hypothetical protein
MAQPNAKSKREGHNNAPENDEEANGYYRIANTYILKDDTKGYDDKKNPYTFSDKIAIPDVRILTDVRILARQVNDPADKIAQNNPYNNDNNGHNNEGKGACNPRSIFSKLAYSNKIQAKREEDNDKYPVDDLTYHKRRKGMYTTFLKKVDNSNLVRPFIKTEKDQKSCQKLFNKPAYNKTTYHHNNHDDNIQKDLGEIVIKIKKHVLKKVNHENNLIRCLQLCQ